MIIDESFIHNLPFPAYIKDLNSRYVHVSKKFAKEFLEKHNPLDCVGLSHENLSFGLSALVDVFLEGDKLVFEGKDVLLIESGLFGDGVPRVYIGRKTPYRNKDSEIIGIFYYAHEINSSMLNLTASHFTLGAGGNINHDVIAQHKIDKIVHELNITDRELDILFFLSRGFSVKQIAKVYDNSHRTIETHINSIKNKLTCSSRDEIIANAFLLGLNNRIPHKLLEQTMAINVVLDD